MIEPETALAVAYARASARPALNALFELDARLRETQRQAREPMIAAIKLAWWREALASERPAKGEPLLDRLAALDIDTAPLASIAEGWAALGEDDLAEHARLRGGTLFRAAAALLGGGAAPVEQAGQGWALADIGRGEANGATAFALAQPLLAEALASPWPQPLRPLGMLAKLAARDPFERQGSPARMLAMLRFRLVGR